MKKVLIPSNRVMSSDKLLVKAKGKKKTVLIPSNRVMSSDALWAHLCHHRQEVLIPSNRVMSSDLFNGTFSALATGSLNPLKSGHVFG